MVVKIIIAIFLFIAIALPVRFFMLGKSSAKKRPVLGVVEGQLSRCSSKPNCVSSGADPGDAGHYLAPLNVSLSPLEKIKK